MVVFFTEEDLVSFGEFMISDKRVEAYVNRVDLDPKKVNEDDVSTWAFIQQQINEGKYGN